MTAPEQAALDTGPPALKPCPNGCTLERVEPSCPDHGDVKGLRVVMPSGIGCYYVDEDHSYWRMRPDDGKRGTRLTGVTTVTKALDISPDNLMRWAARTNGIGIARLVTPLVERLRNGEQLAAEDLEWLTDHESIWSVLEARKLTYDDVREAKADIGTNVHREAFQALAVGEPVPRWEELTGDEKGYAQAVVNFWLDHDPEAEYAEQIVVSELYGIAGRFDFLGELTHTCGDLMCPCGEFVGKGPGVIDAKTGNYLSAAAHAQVHGYRVLATESQLDEPSWGALLKLRGDGTYELVVAEGSPADFLSAVATYRSAGAIDREAGKRRKARQAARR